MTQDKLLIFQHALRIAKCMKECCLHRNDARSVINILTLERCLQARSWHNSTAVLRQLHGIGVAYVRLLALRGVKTFDGLRQVQPEELEVWCKRSTPFGQKVLSDLERIPRYEMIVLKESQVIQCSVSERLI
jgi:ATP-dependent DNA helicase HFM1/MER3